MGLINQVGFFRGHIVDAGLSQSTNGFPQEVMALKAEEMLDPDSGEFLPVDAEHDEITGYLVLIGSNDKMTKSGEQVMKVTGWDGADLGTLVENDYADTPLTFEVKENTYKENTTLQVNWIDVPEATGSRTVSKISKEDAAALQARYAATLAKHKPAAKPVSAKKNTKATAKVVEEKVTKPKTPPKAPKVPKPPKAPTKTAEPVGKCSAEDAYNECYRLKRDNVSDELLNELWLKEVAKVNEDEAKITEEEWFTIKERIVGVTAKV